MAYLKIDALLDFYFNTIAVLDFKFIDLLSFL